MSTLYYFLLALCLSALLQGCNSSDKSSAGKPLLIQGREVILPDTSQTHQLDGRILAMAYCQACHLFPEPSLLTKDIWKKYVLPNMALRLGLNVTSVDPYSNVTNAEIQNIVNNQVYPFEPLIPLRDWNKIADYYLTQAPDSSLPQDKRTPVSSGLPGFSLWIPAVHTQKSPLTTLIQYESASSMLYVGDRRSNLYMYNQQLQLVDSVILTSPPAHLLTDNGKVWMLTMGIMDPSDDYQGQLLVKSVSANEPEQVLTQLPRPVHLAMADLNSDGEKDWIVSGFGNQTGRLSWFERGRGNQVIEHVVKPVPGTLKTEIFDFNKDGLPDIMALIAQGDEQICIFYNKGKGEFEQQTILRFPPVQGSSYFELADFNQDGAPDILYTNGDNADYSTILKKYHGVHIFVNDGKNTFQEKWFYPMYGASKAIARDFDRDGDLDVSAISFFSDPAIRPEESFIYFENKGNLNFQPYSTDIYRLGRWLVMDAGDIDGDGDQDIILGSFVLSSGRAPEKLATAWKKGPPFVVLQNMLINTQ